MIKDPKLTFIINTIKDAYSDFGKYNKASLTDKAAFDLVTSTDFNIENYIISKIKERYPQDVILSEETNSETVVAQGLCTWTIDPIDGTYNMANGIKIYGIQCAMYVDGTLNLAAVYIPHFDELYYAKAGEGAYLNGERITVKPNSLDHCVVSMGDFPHTRPNDIEQELRVITSLSTKIARIRMFGAACMDFTCVASGKTSGTVIFTKNKWDIAPGILLCQEAGALLKGNNGDYTDKSNVVIAVATEELYQTIIDSMK